MTETEPQIPEILSTKQLAERAKISYELAKKRLKSRGIEPIARTVNTNLYLASVAGLIENKTVSDAND